MRTGSLSLRSITDVATVIVLGAAAVHLVRSTGPRQPSVPALEVSSELSDSLWTLVWTAARHKGSTLAPVRVVQFSDFECPACRRFARETQSLVESHAGVVAMGYAHFPLAQHRFARHAAMAAECVGETGGFWSAHDSLFAHQEDFGLVSWHDIVAGPTGDSIAELEECIRTRRHTPRINAHRDLGEHIGASATPTVVVNGRVLSRPPTRLELDSIIVAELAVVAREQP